MTTILTEAAKAYRDAKLAHEEASWNYAFGTDRSHLDSLADAERAAAANLLSVAERADEEPGLSTLGEDLAAIRDVGWSVAVHNDYTLAGRHHTFWLFTRGDKCRRTECPIEDESAALRAMREALTADTDQH